MARAADDKKYTTEVVAYDKGGNPASGRKVCLGFTGFLGGMSENAYTDSSGVATIHHASKGEVKVYVDGDWSSHKTKGRAPGRINVYLKK